MAAVIYMNFRDRVRLPAAPRNHYHLFKENLNYKLTENGLKAVPDATARAYYARGWTSLVAFYHESNEQLQEAER